MLAEANTERALAETLRRRPDTPPDMPAVDWDKHEIECDWRELIKPLKEMQKLAKAMSGSQDRASFHIHTDEPAAVLAISDQLGRPNSARNLFHAMFCAIVAHAASFHASGAPVPM